MSYRRVFLSDLADGGRRVLVQGVCVWRESVGAQQLRVEIDDGTGVALVQLRGEAVAAELQDVLPGMVVRAMGDVQAAPVFASGRAWKQWIDAASVSIVDDPNAESLHVLETLLLYKSVYVNDPAAPSVTSDPVSLPLLAIPGDSPEMQPTVGEKRKLVAFADCTSPTPRPPPPSALEMNSTQRSLLHHNSHGTVAPAEYQFHVSGADLKHIGTGAKTLEMRLNNPPYSIIRTNDRIKFNGKITTTVKAVRKYAKLRSALEMEQVASLLPPPAGGRGVSLNGAVRLLRQFISEAEEANHGVAVFEFEAPPSMASVPRTPEEWNKLVYEYVEKKGGAGCSLRDLQFAFPALAVDKIEAVLTDLQMDAVIYLANGVYRLI